MKAIKPGLADLKWLRKQAAVRPKQPLPPPQPVTQPSKAPALPEQTLDAQDKALFRQAVKWVQPLAPPNRQLLAPVASAPMALLKQRRQAATGTEPNALPLLSDHYVPAHMAADHSSFVQAGHNPDLLKQLQKNKWAIQASLDLHGATLEEARLRLDQFLSSCLAHQIRCVRIVHGKGHGSQNNKSVLKQTVRRWLGQLESVLAYIECSEQNGGAGAVQVLLRK